VTNRANHLLTHTEVLDEVNIFLRLRDPQTTPTKPPRGTAAMTDLVDQPSSDYDFTHGIPDPCSSRARFRNALIERGEWHDDTQIQHLLGLGQTVRIIDGQPLYTMHRLPLLGPIDPATERGLYVTALLNLSDRHFPIL
jgi:hypothetical protein